MNNQIIKHKILTSLNDVMIKNNGFTDTYYSTDIVYSHYKTKNRIFWNKEKFDIAIVNLASDGYILRKISGSGAGSEISFTEKGLSALTSNKFRNDNNKQIGLLIKDYGILICNILVATAAIYALQQNGDNNKKEIKRVEVKFDSLIKAVKRDTIVILINNPSIKSDKEQIKNKDRIN
jgi:hypothetical protein